MKKNTEIKIIDSFENEFDIEKLSIREHKALRETGHLLSTKTNRRRLEESIRQLHAGKVITYDFDEV